ncbi:ADAMTSL1 [Cordylochernes scorpioides]|uniref:ADAMTSL1 n=1 Tax=Cordylochernes scorpioides TaxID=51811 RepID=A0ABY6L6T8_9ARAC|nr:ADAMTSL1 [Cordylochernes scorpioides]
MPTPMWGRPPETLYRRPLKTGQILAGGEQQMVLGYIYAPTYWYCFSFAVGDWGPCSVTCGKGSRSRLVHCKIFLEFSRTEARLPDSKCPGRFFKLRTKCM